MKKGFLVVVAIFLLLCGSAFGASSIVPSIYLASPGPNGQGWGNVLLIKMVCTAHTDGTFDSREITTADIPSKNFGNLPNVPYYQAGYYLAHAWAVNSATDDHTNAAVVTITDSTGQQVVGATVGDTLTLSQTASATAYLSASRVAAQRPVVAPITAAIADTGSTATVQTIFLLLVR